MKTAICTISTKSHLFKTRALFHSLKKNSDADLFCLVIDEDGAIQEMDGAVMLRPESLRGQLAEKIRGKYRNDRLRWACKPLLLKQLLQNGYDKVIYVDNDLYFFSSPDSLFQKLNENSVLLTPHGYPADPTAEQFWLEANFRIGLYNAGFVGVNQKATEALDWWAACCAYNVKKSAWRGLFDDQKYLDMLPVLFSGVHLLKHSGCNVAFWNIGQRKAGLNSEGAVVFDGRWPLIFVHFTKGTLREIHRGNMPLLEQHLKEYLTVLNQFDPAFNLRHLTRYSFREAVDLLRHITWLTIRKFEQE